MENTNDLRMDAFLVDLESKINAKYFSDKKELTKYLESHGQEFKENQSFNHQVLDMLNKFDETNKTADAEEFEGFKESTRADGSIESTFIKDDKVVSFESDNSIKKEIDKDRNEFFSNELKEKTVEESIDTLKTFVYDEDEESKNASVNIEDTKEIIALKYYNDLNNLGLMFTESGLAIDKDGNNLEAIMDIFGNFTIYKLSQSTFDNGGQNKQVRTLLYKINKEDMENYNNKETIRLNEKILEYLKQNINDFEYILNDPTLNLTEVQKNEYRNALSLEIEMNNKDNIQMQNVNAKQYVYKSHHKPMIENAFVSTIILSTSTLFFGMLCLTYFLMNISK